MEGTQLRNLVGDRLAGVSCGRVLERSRWKSCMWNSSCRIPSNCCQTKELNLRRGCDGFSSGVRSLKLCRETLCLRQNSVRHIQCCSRTGVSSSDSYKAESKRNFFDEVKEGFGELIGRSSTRRYGVESELLFLSLPAMAGQAIEPSAQLMETAFVGRLGPLELASLGVSVSVFSMISKLFYIPLLSITTSFVAEDISKTTQKAYVSGNDLVEDTTIKREKMMLPSISTALLLASCVGVIEAFALYIGTGVFLNLMGVSAGSPMQSLSHHFLRLRALGAPAVVLSFAIQGILRGFKDTRTYLFCTGLGNLLAMVMFPLLMYSLHLGVTGAALSVVLAQYFTLFLLVWNLNQRVVLLPPKIADLHFGSYLKSGSLLLGRTLAVMVTSTLGTSLAARQGAHAMAAHQICAQLCLSMSLLTDALATSAQALIASAYPKREHKRVKDTVSCVLKTGLLAGCFLAVTMGLSLGSLAGLFTKDIKVLDIVKSGVLFVSVSQPINALAFVFDGLHFGVSDFSYAAVSMMINGVVSSTCLVFASRAFGLYGIWFGLAFFMALRTTAGILRLLSKSGPWWFLWEDLQTSEPLLIDN